MSRNGVSINEKKTLINIGLHVEAIDDDGSWRESEILNIIDNKIILKFLKHKEPCNRLFDISSDKWRLISNSQKTNFSLNDDFKKGDCVLAKWHDGNYYLSQILDISSKTKFGTKVKEYHIVYLYDNVEETVSHSRLKSTNSVDQKQILEQTYKNSQINTQSNMIGKRPYRKRGLTDNLESQKTNDNVFYDEKTKKFTESCKIRRLRLSQINDKEKDNDNQDFEIKDINIKIEKDEGVIEDGIKLFDEPKIFLHASNSNQKSSSKQRFSQRKRRSSFRKADYFYPDSVDHTINDKSKSSNNVSQVSTPVIHETFEEASKSPRSCTVFSNQIITDQKDCVPSSNHSPISVSLTSTEESPKQKIKTESFQSEVDIKYVNDQIMYSCNEEGQYLCLICTNKTFRKKKLVLEHIKYYHPNICHEFTENIQPIPKTRYSPNKRYYSSYLKNNRSTLERKKHFSKFKKTCINRTLWNNRNNITEKSDFQNSHQIHLSLPQADHSDVRTDEKPGSIHKETTNIKKQSTSIVYCHRCKKSTEDGCLVQCDVCLCWSHTACYGLSENKDNCNFWECDNCANISSNDGKRTMEWHRDRWRFHSVPENELPWMPKSASAKSQTSLKNICEMQSLLSLSQRILEALTRHLDKLTFKGANDSNSQDDLDILKNLCVYDSIDEIPRLESLDVLNLNNDNEELFKTTGQGNSNVANGVSHNKQLNPNPSTNNHSNFHFSEISFTNSTPIKAAANGHKSINTSLDGILDCDIQKLEILPKADIDALIHDLYSCDDIYKKDNCEHNSKASILDFIDDGCNVNNPNKHTTASTNLDPNLPFSQSICLFQNPEIIEQPETSYLSSDEITNLLFEKVPQKETVSCEDICESERHISSAKTYPHRDSLLSNHYSNFESKPNEILGPSSFDKISFHKAKSEEDILKSKQTDSKLEIEFNDLNSIIQPETSNIDPSTSPVFTDTEMRLNQSDSECLHWLLCKFKCVEKIIESVEATILSSESSADQTSHSESDYNRISKYLQSLLYILKKNQCK